MTQTLSIGPLRLQSGQWLPDVRVAHVCHGQLNADGSNAILVTHGFTSAHTMLEPGHLVAEGSWAPLLGPGRILDTDRYFVVCSNMLGSSFGTTGPRDLRPDTGKPWGPDFPDITLSDIVAVQHRLLQALGVRHLRAVLGPSFGGFQSIQWALDHPDMVDAIGIVSSDFRAPVGQTKDTQRAKLAESPQWHGGWFYEHGGMYETLLTTRLQTLAGYGLERLYEERYPDPVARREAIEGPSRAWARAFDANSLVVLAGAAASFDVRHRVHEIRARALMVQCTTDKPFPANEASAALLAQTQAPSRYIRLDSPYGHIAAGVELARWQDEIRWLLG